MDEPPPTWGTPESYWPFPRPIAAPTDEDRERFRALTPGQRVEWLVMMLRLLEKQFGHLVPPPAGRIAPDAKLSRERSVTTDREPSTP